MKTYMRVLTSGLQSTIVATVALCGIVSTSDAQDQRSNTVKYAVQAAQYCQEGRYDEAEGAIANALESETEKDALYTWYVKGFIHKEIYKNREGTNTHSAHRDMAVEAFLKSKEMANGLPDTYNNNSALKYLATTYYNDAIALAGRFELANELEPDAIMSKYDRLNKAMESGSLNKGAFHKQKGMRYYQLWQQNICDLSLNEKAYACFQISIELDASDCDAWYNAGVVRYSLIQKIRTEKPASCTVEINETAELESVVDLLTKAHNNCPNHAGIVKAIQNIYLALGNNEKASQYEKLIKP